jgi:hypothetical protein
MAEGIKELALVFLLGTAAFVGLDQWRRRSKGAQPSWVKPAIVAAMVVAVLGGVASTYKVIEIGHSGAKATWNNVRNAESGEGGG